MFFDNITISGTVVSNLDTDLNGELSGSELNGSSNIALAMLKCDYNSIQSLNLAANTNLTNLDSNYYGATLRGG